MSAVAVAVALLGATACAGGGHPKAAAGTTAGSTTSTTSVANTSTTVDATKAAILAAYRASWADFLAVAETFPVKPLDSRLRDHDNGKELTGVQQALTRLSALGHYNVGSPELAPVVTSIDHDTAVVTDCIFDHSMEVDAATHKPVEQPNVGHTLDRFVLTRSNGIWYVSDSTILGSGRTGDACTPTAA